MTDNDPKLIDFWVALSVFNQSLRWMDLLDVLDNRNAWR